jgi:hypothetical protein
MRVLLPMKKYTVLLGAIFCIASITPLHSSDPPSTIALIGGQDNSTFSTSSGFAAFVASDGTITPLTLLPVDGSIAAVSINSFKMGILGGEHFSGPSFAALVSPNGSLTAIQPVLPNALISTVAISSSGKTALIGGEITNTTPPTLFAAIVAPNGWLTSLSPLPVQGYIDSVSINSAGSGLIGGQNLDLPGPTGPAFAALVTPNGTLISLAPLPSKGMIFSVSINSSGEGLIGGSDSSSGSGAAFASLVAPNGNLTPLSSLPSSGMINGVSINSFGVGLIGGEDFSGLGSAFAALVSPNGVVTSLSPLPVSGTINSVSNNSAGEGIIGGQSFNAPFAALVSPNGTVTSLSPLPVNGLIRTVSINSAGVGLIGGQNSSTGGPLAFLVAPNGTLTPLALPFSLGIISSVQLADPLIVPESIGPFSSTLNSQFALSYAFEQHYMNQMLPENLGQCCCKPHPRCDDLSQMDCDDALETKNTFWTVLFNDYVYQKKEHRIPTFTNEIAGIITGFDYQGIQDVTIGAGLAYNFNYVHYQHSIGHAAINQETALFYVSLRKPYFFSQYCSMGRNLSNPSCSPRYCRDYFKDKSTWMDFKSSFRIRISYCFELFIDSC